MLRLAAAGALAALALVLPCPTGAQDSTALPAEAPEFAMTPALSAPKAELWHAQRPHLEDATLFRVRLADSYMQTIQANPESFDWVDVARNLKVKITPDERWREEGGHRLVQVTALAVRGGQVVDRATSEAFDVEADQAHAADWIAVPHSVVAGFGKRLVSLGEQVPIDFDDPAEIYAPFSGTMVGPPPTPAKVAGSVRAGDAIVLYAEFTGDALDDQMATRPLVMTLPRQ